MRALFFATIICLLVFARPSFAQLPPAGPYTLSSGQTEIRVWTSGSTTYARVKVTFGDGGYGLDWGQVTSTNNNFMVDIPASYSGGGTTEIVEVSHVYQLGTLASGTYSFSVTSRGTAVKRLQFDRDQSIEHWQAVSLTSNQVSFAISSTGGVTFAYINLYFGDPIFRISDWGTLTRDGNAFYVDVKPEEWTGAPTQYNRARQSYSLGETPPAVYSFTVYSRSVMVSTVNFNPVNQQAPYPNPIDHPDFFLRQHYLDFLNREPDSSGLTFWTNQIFSCVIDALCIQEKRVNVSAAFFLSPEFQNTGSFVLRVYWGSLGKLPAAQCALPAGLLGECRPLYSDYLADVSQVARGIVVNNKLAPEVINANKRAFVDQFVNKAEFRALYDALNNQQFVDKLFTTTGIVPSDSERSVLVNGLDSGTETRSSVVFKVVDGTQTMTDGALVFQTTYGKAFFDQEFDTAFVFMEYVGYLRRNPDQAGYDFWLAKLKSYGNWMDAEMVRAFILSPEYRQRFSQP